MLKRRRGVTHRDWHSVHTSDQIDDERLLGLLRAGSERAFIELVGKHHARMVRLARSYVASETTAEDVVQETWLAALRALPLFEGRSSVKTWLYGILVNRARTVGVREHKHVPVPDPEQAVTFERFNSDGSWAPAPTPWVDEVDDRVRAEGMLKSIQVAIDELPTAQREVLTLRDVDGMTAAEACEILDVADGHQRVLLHRARTRLRNALQAEYGEFER